MSEYKEFSKWQTDAGYKAIDYLNTHHNCIYVSDGVGGYHGVSLTATDIKRLMACVERYEADERSES